MPTAALGFFVFDAPGVEVFLLVRVFVLPLFCVLLPMPGTLTLTLRPPSIPVKFQAVERRQESQGNAHKYKAVIRIGACVPLRGSSDCTVAKSTVEGNAFQHELPSFFGDHVRLEAEGSGHPALRIGVIPNIHVTALEQILGIRLRGVL